MSTANASRRVPQEQIERARSVDLVHFLTQHLPPGELKRIGSQWTLRSHDSMRISADGRWNWFSQGVGGGDAISYLQSVENMSFIDAVQMLAGGNYISLTDDHTQRTECRLYRYRAYAQAGTECNARAVSVCGQQDSNAPRPEDHYAHGPVLSFRRRQSPAKNALSVPESEQEHSQC